MGGVIYCVDIFYVDDGQVASPGPDWPHRAFDTLTGLFNTVGLLTNVRKTVRMLCQPCRVVEIQLKVVGECINGSKDSKRHTWKQ